MRYKSFLDWFQKDTNVMYSSGIFDPYKVLERSKDIREIDWKMLVVLVVGNDVVDHVHDFLEEKLTPIDDSWGVASDNIYGIFKNIVEFLNYDVEDWTNCLNYVVETIN